ncbi:hypothetical protein THAOC_10834 [Thalassiosira oceanica]|uniref:Uncharacterized protein n=1 Tax=Thalassiosira oceanica TaxID=159749 RepID=K0TC02_THAOC|nr:hypothetical protein THAOC_10834 [Thalassiosira oceanica]|eukprot:EJK68032.1 hypothetical protein THAOC_10834 [Thalassiosira oceanica]
MAFCKLFAMAFLMASSGYASDPLDLHLASLDVVKQQGTEAAAVLALESDAGDVIPPNLRGATLVDSFLGEEEDFECKADGSRCKRNWNPWGESQCCSGKCERGLCHMCAAEGSYCGRNAVGVHTRTCCEGLECVEQTDERRNRCEKKA